MLTESNMYNIGTRPGGFRTATRQEVLMDLPPGMNAEQYRAEGRDQIPLPPVKDLTPKMDQFDKLGQSVMGTIPGGMMAVNLAIAESIKKAKKETPGLVNERTIDDLIDVFLQNELSNRLDPRLKKDLRDAGPQFSLTNQNAVLGQRLRRQGLGNRATVEALMTTADPAGKQTPALSGIRDLKVAAGMQFSVKMAKEQLRTHILSMELKNKTNAAERQYQDALNASTRGLYGDSEIKLRETKKALQEAYERNTFEARRENELLDRGLTAELFKQKGTIKQSNQIFSVQQRKLAAFNEVKDLRGLDAESKLASIQGQLGSSVITPERREDLIVQKNALVAITKNTDGKRSNTAIIGRENMKREAGIAVSYTHLTLPTKA